MTPPDTRLSTISSDAALPITSLAAQRDKTANLNGKFESLAFDLGDGDDGDFLSGWQCENPFVEPLLVAIKQRAEAIDHRRYSYFDAHADLIDGILTHHENVDGRRPPAVLCGCGTTSLLFTWAAFLQSQGVSTVYYVPPLYITLHMAFDRFGIRTVAVSQKQPYEPGFSLTLPDEIGAYLMLTDPVWFSGTAVPEHAINEIRSWQERTSSTVFVDGSLQYLPWQGERRENSSGLASDLTIRLVCPSKQLCTHGYRFSYMLVPTHLARPLAWTYTNIFGPAPADSIAFAHEAILAIADGSVPKSLMKLASQRFAHLVEVGAIRTSLKPHCGYFVFARIEALLPHEYVKIDGSYFDQNAYPGYSKLNLLSPSLSLIGDAAALAP